ncbi:YciI family protein [Photobacterium galatheae]|uniref:GTP cyclohydrolase n=1 Tax=Photobacterium galatheae TaxID=1654360 RepID=A0A066RSK5_9GAMM|nr:YciI family protein [Photobacterium galatheae]KDM93440.1 GTP cyclohydrolase [Photobacterium galatheae]MCM0147020.1 GTP cyclohydrolase [Photobacterium galatheae]
MFVVSLTYTCSLSEIEKHLPTHIAYLDQQYAAGIFLASGRKEPRTGGVILANAASRADLEQVLLADPFRQHGLATYEVTEFIPTKTCEAFSFLKQSL